MSNEQHQAKVDALQLARMKQLQKSVVDVGPLESRLNLIALELHRIADALEVANELRCLGD